MNGCCCPGVEDTFDAALARKELRKLRRKGPDRSTAALTDTLARTGVDGLTLLDIGGGIGAVQAALFAEGIREAVSVEGSGPYEEVAAELAAERGYEGRVTRFVGDFVERAHDVPEADLVTLDRVICCYPNLEALVRASAAKATRLYGVVFPRDRWTVRAVVASHNLSRAIRRRPFRTFVYSNRTIDRVIRAQGFEEMSRLQTYVWRVAVYARRTQPSRGSRVPPGTLGSG